MQNKVIEVEKKTTDAKQGQCQDEKQAFIHLVSDTDLG